MKLKWLRNALLGVAVFVAIVAGSLLLLRNETNELRELTLDDVVTKIDKGEVREAIFKQAAIEVTDFDGKKYFANVDSDATRERLLVRLREYNKINQSKPIAVGEVPGSSRFRWIVFVQAAPIVLFFVFCAVTLGVIVWAVRTISGNKG